jgi:hypothetical protein
MQTQFEPSDAEGVFDQPIRPFRIRKRKTKQLWRKHWIVLTEGRTTDIKNIHDWSDVDCYSATSTKSAGGAKQARLGRTIQSSWPKQKPDGSAKGPPSSWTKFVKPPIEGFRGRVLGLEKVVSEPKLFDFDSDDRRWSRVADRRNERRSFGKRRRFGRRKDRRVSDSPMYLAFPILDRRGHSYEDDFERMLQGRRKGQRRRKENRGSGVDRRKPS